jgi:hypothetical protein
VERLRIFVGNMPRLLRDIVVEIVRFQPDMEITDQHSDSECIITPCHADAFISGERTHAELKIATVANTNTGGGGRLVEALQLSTVELSPEVLVKAIRRAAGRMH